MLDKIGHKLKVVVLEKRNYIGYLTAYDKHMNLVLSDCEENREVRPKEGEQQINKRMLGFVILRGDRIVSTSVIGPPRKGDVSASV